MAVDFNSKTTPYSDKLINDLRYYPSHKLTPIINWFINIFIQQTITEGWEIKIIYYDHYSVYAVRSNDYTKSNGHNPQPNSFGEKLKSYFQIAKEYGWIIDSYGIIWNYDINKLTRNKHLLTGNELGLL